MIAFLSFAIIALLFVVLVLIARANELSVDLKGGKFDYTSQSRINGYLLLGFMILMFAGSAYSFKVLYLPTPEPTGSKGAT